VNDPPHRCTRCNEPITEGERWEYTQGAPRFGEEQTAPRIHSRCMATLIKETLAAFARVPEDKQDDPLGRRSQITFEIEGIVTR
jgi:hypothetical protein